MSVNQKIKPIFVIFVTCIDFMYLVLRLMPQSTRIFPGFVSLVVFTEVLQDEDVSGEQILARRHSRQEI